jgi:adenylate cyclase
MSEAIESREWTDEDIRAQLERILAHPEFRATEKMRNFLRFVVEETLTGNARHLKGFTIATKVFGRDETFDAAHDPVVRIQAGRLRRAMERYYLVAGSDDPIHIDIPKGSYVPAFNPGFAARSARSSRQGAAPGGGVQESVRNWPSLLVQPFEDLTERPDLAHLAPGLATDLGIELANTGDLRVMVHSVALNGQRAASPRPDFLVQGSIRADGATVKVVIQLVDADSHELLWTDSLKSGLDDDRLIDFQERTATAIATHIAGQHGAVYRAMT